MKKTKKKNKPRLFIRKADSGKDREIFGKKSLSLNKKEEKRQAEFPNIYRIISERIIKVESVLLSNSRIVIASMISIFILALIFAFGLDFYHNFKTRQGVELNREKIASEINYWQQVVDKYNNYRDGYFQLSILEYKIGNKDKSRLYLEKVLELDPNFEAAKSLGKLL